jgi:hypothetical protein
MIRLNHTIFIENLPQDVILRSFSYLDPQNLGRCCLVSKKFHCFASDEILWKPIVEKILQHIHFPVDRPTKNFKAFLQTYAVVGSFDKVKKRMEDFFCDGGVFQKSTFICFFPPNLSGENPNNIPVASPECKIQAHLIHKPFQATKELRAFCIFMGELPNFGGNTTENNILLGKGLQRIELQMILPADLTQIKDEVIKTALDSLSTLDIRYVMVMVCVAAAFAAISQIFIILFAPRS